MHDRFHLCFNMLTANYEYFHSNWDSLPQPIQMQSSKKPKTFCSNFIAFLESTKFGHFEKNE